jgi:hypothetical protein
MEERNTRKTKRKQEIGMQTAAMNRYIPKGIIWERILEMLSEEKLEFKIFFLVKVSGEKNKALKSKYVDESQ